MPDSASPASTEVELVAGGGDGGRRLDDFLASSLSVGRRAAVRLVARTRVNGRPANKGLRLRSGDVVRVPRDEEPSSARHPAPEVVRATPDVLVLAKPAGLPSVALRGAAGDSLAVRIAAHFPECAQVGRPGEAGLVHRLDTGTSGLLLAARNQATYDALRAQFSARTVRKEYLALVSGTIRAPVRITTPIGQHRGTRRRMRAVSPESSGERYHARPASTDVTPERALGAATLVRATTNSGARHQIRVHLASIGHPLLADPLYGDAPGQPDGARNAARGFRLHACRIEWRDPATGEDASDRLAPPADWDDALGDLGTQVARAR